MADGDEAHEPSGRTPQQITDAVGDGDVPLAIDGADGFGRGLLRI